MRASTTHAEPRFEVVSVVILHMLWMLKAVTVYSRHKNKT